MAAQEFWAMLCVYQAVRHLIRSAPAAAPDWAKMQLQGRSHTKPGSLLRSQFPIRTRVQ